jgi:hypothetical protein
MPKKAQVWASDAMTSIRSEAGIRYMPLNPDVFKPTSEELEEAASVVRKYTSGDLADPSELPYKFCGPYLDSKVENLSDFFSSGSYLFASERCAEVFLRFDLAGGGFSPVEIYHGDRKTLATTQPIFLLNIRGKKSAFASDKVDMTTFKRAHGPKGLDSRYRPMSLADDQIVLTAAALDGCDLWFDDEIARIFFVSARLAEAIHHAGVEGKMFLKSCRV